MPPLPTGRPSGGSVTKNSKKPPALRDSERPWGGGPLYRGRFSWFRCEPNRFTPVSTEHDFFIILPHHTQGKGNANVTGNNSSAKWHQIIFFIYTGCSGLPVDLVMENVIIPVFSWRRIIPENLPFFHTCQESGRWNVSCTGGMWHPVFPGNTPLGFCLQSHCHEGRKDRWTG